MIIKYEVAKYAYMYVSFPTHNNRVNASHMDRPVHTHTRTHIAHMLLLVRIRTLAGGDGTAAAAVSQQGLELSKNWPCLLMDVNVSTVQI